LRSSSRVSSLRAGSRDGAKQLCGLRLSRQLPRERTATMCQIASQKPLRAARRLIKAASSTPSQGNGLRQATHRGNRDPQQSGRLPAAASAQLVLGSACGPLKRAMVRRIRMSINSRSTARGPIQRQRGRAFDASGRRESTGSGVPLLAGLFVRSPWRAPVRQIAPRAGPVVLVWRERGRVFEVPLPPHASTLTMYS
jgi:hypothetical protein